MSSKAATLASLLKAFFERHLVVDRRLRPNTVLAYRDAIKLFLRFATEELRRPADALEVHEALQPALIRGFLDWLERERGCGVRTRNHRLSVLRSFVRYVAEGWPEYLELCQQVRAIPTARFDRPEIEYLDKAEVGALLAATKRDAFGLRDHALLLLLYNTGARVQELVDLDVGALRLEATPRVRLKGKGGKERTCPLWGRTARALERWLTRRRQLEQDSPVFVSSRGTRITRSGVAYVLRRSAGRAGLHTPNHARRLTPHVFRHTTAMHLLESGVDLTVIASWLGHVDISTTHAYVTISDRMKRAAVFAAACTIPELLGGDPPPAHDVLTWLDAICYRPRYVERIGPPGPSMAPPGDDST